MTDLNFNTEIEREIYRIAHPTFVNDQIKAELLEANRKLALIVDLLGTMQSKESQS